MEKNKIPFSQEVIDAWDMKRKKSSGKSKAGEKPALAYPLPRPQMRLYGFRGFLNGAYYDTERELIEHIMSNECSLCSLTALEYLGDFAGRSDVISCTDRQGHVTIQRQVKMDIIEVFDNEMSVLEGKPVWIGGYGNLRTEYAALRTRGISLNHDVFADYDALMERFRGIAEQVDKEVSEEQKGHSI